jgi:anaerobic magnesium-protoporphyrin IX monomethyl ester cyclase
MRIVFYKPLMRPEFCFDPFKAHYLGFSHLITYLKQYEKECNFVVARTLDAVIEAKPDVIGISGVTEMWGAVKNSVVWLRNKGFKGPIIVGGPHVTALPETLPLDADCGVIGSGEETLRELIRSYKTDRNPDLNEIKGIAYRDEEGQLIMGAKRTPIDLDDLPIDVLINPSITFEISTVQGCPFHCVHCVEHDMQGKMRYLSPDRLVSIMEERLRLTGNPYFFFQDDTFLAPPDRLQQVHELLRKRNLFGKFIVRSVSLNANLVKEETIPMLKDIGVISLGMGMESLNPRMLKVLKKGVVTLEHIDRTIRFADKADIPIGGSQVYGFPGETRDEMVDSIKRVKHYEQATTFRHWSCFVCQPLPGSQFWVQELERGKVSIDMDFSTLRIDGDCRFFNSPWYYGNEAHVSRDEFILTLREHDMIANNFFVPPNTWDVQKNETSSLKRIGKKIYHGILHAIEGRRNSE